MSALPSFITARNSSCGRVMFSQGLQVLWVGGYAWSHVPGGMHGPRSLGGYVQEGRYVWGPEVYQRGEVYWGGAYTRGWGQVYQRVGMGISLDI